MKREGLWARRNVFYNFFFLQIEADPDIMPRTDSFGLDYMTFVDLCPNDTPPAFLRLAFYCCTVSIFSYFDFVYGRFHFETKKS